MQKFETVIHIVTDGTDVYDAGEKAGQLLSDQLLGNESFYIHCERTVPFETPQRKEMATA